MLTKYKDQNDGKEHNNNSNDIEQSLEKQDATHRVFLKNKQNTLETCKKCTRKILNGVRCRECTEAIHWSCAGVPKDKIENTKKELPKKTRGLFQHARSQRIPVKRTPMKAVQCVNVKIRK